MDIPKERIEELKKINGSIFQAVIQYRDEDGEKQTIEFIHRRPSYEDYETFQNDVMKLSGPVANHNLIAGMTLEPAGSKIAEQLGDCPIAVDQWVMKNVLPFFGGDVVEVSSKKL